MQPNLSHGEFASGMIFAIAFLYSRSVTGVLFYLQSGRLLATTRFNLTEILWRILVSRVKGAIIRAKRALHLLKPIAKRTGQRTRTLPVPNPLQAHRTPPSNFLAQVRLCR